MMFAKRTLTKVQDRTRTSKKIDSSPYPRLATHLIALRCVCAHNTNQIAAVDAEARVLAARHNALAEEIAMAERQDAGRQLRQQHEKAVEELAKSLEDMKRSRKDALAASLKVFIWG